MDFSKRLKQLRNEKNITQNQLANILSMNIRSIRKYESEEMEPTLSVVIAIADYFNVSIDYLVGRLDTKNYSIISNARIIKRKKADGKADGKEEKQT